MRGRTRGSPGLMISMSNPAKDNFEVRSNFLRLEEWHGARPCNIHKHKTQRLPLTDGQHSGDVLRSPYRRSVPRELIKTIDRFSCGESSRDEWKGKLIEPP